MNYHSLLHGKKLKIVIGALVLCLILLLAWIIFSGGRSRTHYLTETVRRGTITKTVNSTGEVGAAQLVTVGAQVSGQIEKLNVILGQKVKKGDLIAQIDSMTQQNELDTNKARLQTYRSQLVSRQIALKVAQSQYDREVTLMKNEATSTESLENAKNTLAAARADVDELKSLIRQTQIAVSTSEVNLGYTKIVSPLDGTVVSVPVEEGQTVNANQTTPTIVQVADLTRMEIKMEISEGDVTRVNAGMPVSYTILSEPEKVFTTTLLAVDPGLTTLTNGTYEGYSDSDTAIYYYGKLLVSNEDGTLRIGMTTQNVITIGQAKDILIVPGMAITEREGKKYVQVLGKNDQVQEREIETGLSDNMRVEVVSGLEEGEKVILDRMTSEEIAQRNQAQGRPRRM